MLKTKQLCYKIVLCGLFVSCMLYLTTILFADVPYRINFQGRYKESGVPFTGTKSCKFRITDAAGNAYYDSGEVSISFQNGLFNYVLTPGATVPWRDITPYLEVTIDGTQLIPREQINSSAYAFYATSAAYAFSAAPPANMVTTDTNQTITGVKTFTSSVTITGAGGLDVNYGIRAGTITLTGNRIFASDGVERALFDGATTKLYHRIDTGGWFVIGEPPIDGSTQTFKIDSKGQVFAQNHIIIDEPGNTLQFSAPNGPGIIKGMADIYIKLDDNKNDANSAFVILNGLNGGRMR